MFIYIQYLFCFSNCWEVLGDAYLARKAYTAAQKSYQKVVQLRPGSLYPQLQIARIKLVCNLIKKYIFHIYFTYKGLKMLILISYFLLCLSFFAFIIQYCLKFYIIFYITLYIFLFLFVISFLLSVQSK